MSTILPLFWNLSASQKNERLKASTKLIASLEQLQDKFFKEQASLESATGIQLAELSVDEALDACNASDVTYSIKRLIRGLASSRESSRLGFAVALTEIIGRINTISARTVLKLIDDASQSQSSTTGQEERDLLLLQLFGLSSVVESGLLFREGRTHMDREPFTSKESFALVISQLVALGERKNWLKESAWWMICLALKRLPSSQVAWKDAAMDECLLEVFGSGQSKWTREKVALALKLQHMLPKGKLSALLPPTFEHNSIIHIKNFPALSSILVGTDSAEDSSTASLASTVWNTRLHFVWDAVLDEIKLGNRQAQQISLVEFFRKVVDETMFGQKASSSRKYHGFLVFEKCLWQCPLDSLPMLFTQNMMRTLVNNLSSKDRYLHEASQQLAKSLQTLVEKNPTAALPIVMTLLGENGSKSFDRLTGTKTVESILMVTDVEGIQKYASFLNEEFRRGSEKTDVDELQQRRSWAIDQMTTLIRNGAIKINSDTVKAVLDMLMIHGIFIIHKKGDKQRWSRLKPPLSDSLREKCRYKLLACLGDLMQRSNSRDPAEPQTGSIDGEHWVSYVAKEIIQLQADAKHCDCLIDVDDRWSSIRESVLSTLQMAAKDSRASIGRAARLVCNGIIVQMFCDGLEDDSLDALERSASAFQHLSIPATTSKRDSGGAEIDSEEILPIDTIVDILIEFMEKASGYLRSIATQAFRELSEELQESSIELLLAQFSPESVDEAEADDDDFELEDASDENSETSSRTSQPEAQSELSVSEVGDDDLRERIEEVLRVNKIERAEGDADADAGSSSSEELLDDEQMLQFDDKLAEVFRTRRADRVGKQGMQNVQIEATHFKSRLIDLIEAYIKVQAANPLVLLFIVPLVEVIVHSGKDEIHLAEKLNGLLRSKLAKGKSLPMNVNLDRTSASLEKLHELVRRYTQNHLTTINACSIYLSRVLSRNGAAEAVTRVYLNSLADFSHRKASALHPSFFGDFCKRQPEAAWLGRDEFLRNATSAVNPYRKIHIFEFIGSFIGQLEMDGRVQDFRSYLPSLCDAICCTVTSACSDEAKTLNAQQLKSLCKPVLTIARVSRKFDVVDGWNLKQLGDVQELLDKSTRFQNSAVKTTWHKLVEIISQSSVPAEVKSIQNQKAVAVAGMDAERNLKTTNGLHDFPSGGSKKRRIGKEELNEEQHESDGNAKQKKKRKKTKHKVFDEIIND